MEKAERIRRWQALNENVQREDVTAWRDHYVADLAQVEVRPTALAS
jgi:trehalose 6-phosphate synthase